MMAKRYLRFVGLLLACWAPLFVAAQQARVLIHAHNDYHQRVPFYQAYAQQVFAIEADVFAADDGTVLVGHDRDELQPHRTLEAMYIRPIVDVFTSNGGRAWAASDNRFVLLIDLKTPAATTLRHVVDLIASYPEVFDETVNPHAVTVVISGDMPNPGEFADYPSFISFDGRLAVDYTAAQLERVAFISAPFSGYASWNGKGALTDRDRKQVADAIDKAHGLGKKIRFWGTPDGITAWHTLHKMGVDIINTDQVERCAAFFADFDKKQFSLKHPGVTAGTARAERLDATTRAFRGFDGKSMVLSQPIPVYTPSYAADGAETDIRNVILLIGDGMGLAQLQAAYAFNRALTTLLIPTIGLQETGALDAYTTDSAAGGSALATGEKTKNRHISVDSLGRIHPSIAEYAAAGGMACGVVTAGNVADATPAAFYGHAIERDDSDALTAYLMDGRLDLLIGSGKRVFTHRKDGRDLWKELMPQYRMLADLQTLDDSLAKTICIDDRFERAVNEKTIGLLADATRLAIRQLNHAEKKGFFLMVEGAKIDYAGHANSLPGSIMETLSFDLAVAEALKFADEDGHTLVVVTGDHETGGLTLIDGDWEAGEITALYMTDDHTPLMLPVFAYGPASDRFSGVYPNTEIFHKLKRLLEL